MIDKKTGYILAIGAAAGLAFFAWRRKAATLDAQSNDAAGPRLPGLPVVPPVPAVSGAVPNMPRMPDMPSMPKMPAAW